MVFKFSTRFFGEGSTLNVSKACVLLILSSLSFHPDRENDLNDLSVMVHALVASNIGQKSRAIISASMQLQRPFAMQSTT